MTLGIQTCGLLCAKGAPASSSLFSPYATLKSANEMFNITVNETALSFSLLGTCCLDTLFYTQHWWLWPVFSQTPEGSWVGPQCNDLCTSPTTCYQIVSLQGQTFAAWSLPGWTGHWGGSTLTFCCILCTSLTPLWWVELHVGPAYLYSLSYDWSWIYWF